MNVKIIKSDSPKLWYKNEIGKTCEVVELDDVHYLVSGSDFLLIAHSDCEILTN